MELKAQEVGSFIISEGVDGTFKTSDGKTVTVKNGIITAIV